MSSIPAPDRPTSETASPTAVILAAGRGSRVAAMGDGPPKPILPLLGLSLAERVVLSCQAAGIERFVVVVGHRADEVGEHFRAVASRRGCHVELAVATEWERGNGASALAASRQVGDAPFVLTMADHLVEPALLVELLATPPREGEICLGVDRRLEALFEPEDVTKVQLADSRVVRIGKDLERWDAGDTGVFYCTRALFGAIRQARQKEHHELSDAVAELAAARRVRAVDVTGRRWFDLDTAAAFRHAERWLLSSVVKNSDDGYVSSYLNRPLSLRLSKLLVKTRISPNLITLASFLLSLGGAGLLALQGYAAGLLGGVLVQVGSIVDGCDGEVARLKRIENPRGGWLDTILDRYADIAVVLGITISYSATHPGPLALIGGLFSVSGYLMASYVTKEFALRHGRAYPADFLNRAKRRDLRLFGIFVGAVCGFAFEAMVALGALSHLCVVGILARGWWREGRPRRPQPHPSRGPTPGGALPAPAALPPGGRANSEPDRPSSA